MWLLQPSGPVQRQLAALLTRSLLLHAHISATPLHAQWAIKRNTTQAHCDRAHHAVLHVQKGASVRVANASGVVHMSRTAMRLVRDNHMAKGDVLRTAQLAGIMAAKATATLIPLCHNIGISKADVQSSVDEEHSCVRISSEVRTVGTTGVEMEALTAVSVAALTVYDMCKAVDKGMRISDVQLDAKIGGKSGPYRREDAGA